LKCRHPDLEDGSLITWGLQQSKGATGEGIEIDVLYDDGVDWEWPRNIDDKKLSQIMEMSSPSLRICFVNTLKSDSSWLPGNFSPRLKTMCILRKAGLSGVLMCNLFSEQSYWAKMGNQSYLRYDDAGKLTSFEVCYQYRCGWNTGVSFIHLVRSKQQTTYFCINYPSGARDRLEAIFQHTERRHILHRDFFLDTLLADDSLRQWQFDIGQRRLMLLQLEKDFEKAPTNPKVDNTTTKQPASYPRNNIHTDASQNRGQKDIERQNALHPGQPIQTDTHKSHAKQSYRGLKTTEIKKEVDFDSATRQLHKMVRQWLGLRQDCEDLLAQLRFLHETYMKVCEKRGHHWPIDRKVDPGEAFEVLISQCDICVRWVQVYHDRNQTCINLLFHLANQRTAVDTAKIAEQTQRDSASMITIAAVTMLFLPGTFVCTIVSTNLFEFGNGGLQVSSQWWILLAAAIPLTFAVFGIWVGWQRMRRQSQRLKARLKRLELQQSAVTM